MNRSPHNQDEFELLLMDYAAGVLNEAHHLFVSSYITVSPQAHSFVLEFESLGGALIESCDPVAMAQNSLNDVLDMLQNNAAQPQQKATSNTQHKDEQHWPEPLFRYTFPRRWRYVLPGVKAIDIPMENCRSKVLLIKALPGTKIPTHEHRGRELTLILDGALSDESGHYQRGDILIRDSGTVHTPVADPREGFLSLNIIDVPVRHRGFYAFLDVIIKY